MDMEDEIAAIEASARGGNPRTGASSSSRGGGGGGGTRSSPSKSKGTGRHSSDLKDEDANGLLVGFPARGGGGGGSKPVNMTPGASKRGSGAMGAPSAGLTAASLMAAKQAGGPPPGDGGGKPMSCKPGGGGSSSNSSKPASYKPGGGSSGSSSKPAGYKPGGGGGGGSSSSSSKPKKPSYMDFDLPEIPPYRPTPLPEIPAFKPAKPPAARMSESERLRQRQAQMAKDASTKSGTADHRPLVGGFAAAAYEAARADHFQPKKSGAKKKAPRDIPSI